MNTTHYLRPLLAPRSIALVGASERADSLGRLVCENLIAGKFDGELFLVNPNHRSLFGRVSHASLEAIGKPVDLALICTPASVVARVLQEGGRQQLRTAAILSGAPDADSAAYRQWRRDIEASARSARVRILGPETWGLIRTPNGLNASYSTITALPGRLTLISQSGSMCTALLDFAGKAGIGFASVVALGGGIDIELGELLEFALGDAETDGILLYVEDVHDARGFLSALRAAARTKPVVVLKGRRHEANAPADVNAPEPTPDEVFEAALKRSGTVRVGSYAQLFSAARLLAAGPFPGGSRLAIVTNGRGPGLLAADRAVEVGLTLPPFTGETVRALEASLPAGAVPRNPCDVRGDATPERYSAAVRTVLQDPRIDVVLALHVTSPRAAALPTALALAEVAAPRRDKAVLSAWLGSVERSDVREALGAGRITNFYTPEHAVEAVSFLAAYRRHQAWLLEVPAPLTAEFPPKLGAAARVRFDALADGRTVLKAREASRLLAAFGIRARRAMRTSVGSPHSIAVYTDRVFGPVISLETGRPPFAPQARAVMLPPLNERLALELLSSVQGAPTGEAGALLVTLLLRVSALVCALPWVVRVRFDVASVVGDAPVAVAPHIVLDPTRPERSSGYRHMAIHPYPIELESSLTLAQGPRLRVRPIRPEDAELERAFVAGLSDESRYLRFMQYLHELTPQMLARFTQVDYDRELALVALTAEAGLEQIVGVTRYAANPDRESAEFAVAVADAWQGRGLARALMTRLIASAKPRGFKRLIGFVLAVNTPMLALAASLGFAHAPDRNDPSQVVVTLELR